MPKHKAVENLNKKRCKKIWTLILCQLESKIVQGQAKILIKVSGVLF